MRLTCFHTKLLLLINLQVVVAFFVKVYFHLLYEGIPEKVKGADELKIKPFNDDKSILDSKLAEETEHKTKLF